MAKNIDLITLERQAYRSNFADGLWDMFLGLMLFQSVIGMVLYRQGWSELLILGSMLAVVAAVYVNLANTGNSAAWSSAIFIPFGAFMVISVVVFSLAAYWLDFNRLYLYGWLFGLAMPLNIALDELYGMTFPWATAVFSAIMVLIGLVLFVRFVQTYPVQEMEVSS